MGGQQAAVVAWAASYRTGAFISCLHVGLVWPCYALALCLPCVAVLHACAQRGGKAASQARLPLRLWFVVLRPSLHLWLKHTPALDCESIPARAQKTAPHMLFVQACPTKTRSMCWSKST